MNYIKRDIINCVKEELNDELGVDINVYCECMEDIYAEICKETFINVMNKENRLKIYIKVISKQIKFKQVEK